MKHSDLIQEGIFGSQQGARGMVQGIIMSLAARGITEIPTSMIAQELRKKAKIDVPYGELVDILSTLPIIGSADAESVTFRDDEQVDSDSARDEVADMATNGVKADKTF